jgi:hypothetical protein
MTFFSRFNSRVYRWLVLEHVEAGASNLPAFERAPRAASSIMGPRAY